MKKICTVSGQGFEITQEDVKFYEKMGVPVPTLCPEERARRRLAWRNERCLYWRTCDKTGKKILSVYHEDSPFVVCDREYWWSDDYDGKEYGRDFDFSKSFFENFSDLMKVVPRPSLEVAYNQNSEYVNITGFAKDCFWCFEADHLESCYFSNILYYSRSCGDCTGVLNGELAYQCIDCEGVYDSLFLQNCKNCSNSAFLKNCRGCKHCFGCVQLVNKQYYFLNEPLTKEEYEKKIAALEFHKYSNLKNMRENFKQFSENFFYKYLTGLRFENSSGDHLLNVKNVHDSFFMMECQDCKYCDQLRNTKDAMDVFAFGFDGCQLMYESQGSGYRVMDLKFCDTVYDGCSNIEYSNNCLVGSQHLFGCIGLRKAEYCILNKQYTKEEYFVLREKIIAHMRKTGEWGEFFPIEMSPFGYNETVAQEYFPMAQEDVLERGWRWRDEGAGQRDSGVASQSYDIPDSIREIPDSICDQVLGCEACGKAYKIQKAELAFYRKMNLPIPRKCADCRHAERMKLRNPRKLWDRTCDNCGVDIRTSFAPNRPERVYCEKCYNEAVD